MGNSKIKQIIGLLLSLLFFANNAQAAIAYGGKCNGTNACTISSGVASGDMVVAFAFRDGNNTAPTIPAGVGWNTISNEAGAASNGAAFVWRVATGTSEASGTFTNATSLVMVSLTGANKYVVGGSGTIGGTGTTVSYPAVTMTNAVGTSWIISCAGHRSTDTNIDQDAQVPTGLTASNKEVATDATDEAVCWLSNAGETSFAQADIAVGGSSSGWRGKTVEIIVADSWTTLSVDFRATSGFVTDPADSTYSLCNTDGSSVRWRGGATFWWSAVYADAERDRNAAASDKRFAGLCQRTNTGTQAVFNLYVLPGTYTVCVPMGDIDNNQAYQYVTIYDNTTLRGTMDDSSGTTTGNFDDSTGTEYSVANYYSSGTCFTGVSLASGLFVMKVGTPGAQTGQSTVSHVTLTAGAAATGGEATLKAMGYH